MAELDCEGEATWLHMHKLLYVWLNTNHLQEKLLLASYISVMYRMKHNTLVHGWKEVALTVYTYHALTRTLLIEFLPYLASTYVLYNKSI